MDADRWQRVQEIFHRADELTGAERKSLLDRECGDDEDLRKQVELLLGSAEGSDEFLQEAVTSAAAAAVSEDPGRRQRFGPYELDRLLGRGGMGAVYLGVRADKQFEKQVAIKLIRSGYSSPEILSRFQAERQILARLEHPNIARLLDAGVGPHGEPYLVMEYIDGAPISRFCKERNLALRERLALFKQVCDGVQYAHRNLVVHRDIKPANILVTAEGVPKLLDFGVAKLIEAEPMDTGQLTRNVLRLMTPEFASPEQIRGEAVSTASDVYSLGVLLFYLLTEKAPYDLTGLSATDIERAVCEVSPELSLVSDTDIRNIISMAMRKEAARRYSSAGELAAEIDRYLSGHAVMARADSALYRTGKFIRRHKAWTAAAAVVLVALTGFSAGMAILAKRLQAERDTAREVTRFLVDIFEEADPQHARGNVITAREVLDQGSARIGERLKDQPRVAAALMETMGQVYENLGLHERAGELIDRAWKIRIDASESSEAELAASAKLLSDSLRYRVKYKEAFQYAYRAMALYRKAYGEQHEKIAELLNAIGLLKDLSGDPKGAQPLLEQSVEMYTRVLGIDCKERLVPMSNLATVLQTRGNLAAAEKLAREIVAMRLKHLGPDHPRTLLSQTKLGQILNMRSAFGEAEKVFRDVHARQARVLGSEHESTLSTRNNLASLLQDLGKLDQAEQLYRETLQMRRKTGGERDLAIVLNNLGSVLEEKGKYAEAEGFMRESLEMRRKMFGEKHVMVARAMRNLGRLLALQGNPRKGEPLLVRAIEIRKELVGENHPEHAGLVVQLGRVREMTGNLESAESLYRDGLAILRKSVRPGHTSLASALMQIGRLSMRRKQYAEAEKHFREALEIRLAAFTAAHWATAETQSALGECLAKQNRTAEGEKLLRAAIETLTTKYKDARVRDIEEAERRLASLRGKLPSRRQL